MFSRMALLAAGLPPDAKQFLQQFYGGKAIGLPDFTPGAPGTQDGVLHMKGQVAGEGFGLEAAPAGDFDGDGFPDLAIGAPGVQGLGPTGGSCYVIRGGAQPIPGPILEASELGDHGIRLVASGVPGFGRFIAGRFNWDGDGVDDLLIGARGGEAYVVLGGAQRPAEFIRGDANGDGGVDITDAVFILGFLFMGGAEPSCQDALDTNDDGKLDITDAVYLLAFLFQCGRDISAPYPAPGPDLTADTLQCVR